MNSLLPRLLFPLLLVAASAHAESRHTYACDNGDTLTLTFGEAADGRPQAIVHRAGGDLVLPQVAAASGARYRAAAVDLHSQDDSVLFDDGSGRQLRCSRGPLPAPAAVPPVAGSSFLTIGGNVSYRSRQALPPEAILTIRVHDVARTGKARVLAEQRYELAGAQVPIPFAATIDRDLIGKRARIQVAARIEVGGKLRYFSDRAYPALKDGQPLPLDIQLKPVAGARGA
ncbi:MAG TPA: YbaY family lipoprotein [Azonexus sp.]